MPYVSSKNRLQEALQKRGEGCPWYTSVEVSTELGKMFVSTVHFCDGRQFSGERMLRKKDAEMMAAAAALPHAIPDPTHLVLRNAKYAYVFIDTENVPTAINTLNSKVSVPGVKYFAFHSQNTTVDTTDLPDSFKVVAVPSALKDAADVGILLYLGRLLHKMSPVSNIALVTRDHFAEAAAQCVMGWSDKQVKVCRDADSVIEWLKTL